MPFLVGTGDSESSQLALTIHFSGCKAVFLSDDHSFANVVKRYANRIALDLVALVKRTASAV
mgnify:CR=1 FL=1